MAHHCPDCMMVCYCDVDDLIFDDVPPEHYARHKCVDLTDPDDAGIEESEGTEP